MTDSPDDFTTAVHPAIFAPAHRIAKRLFERQLKIVFAESCTSGLLATALSQVAGISDVFCGSAVTYRNQTKTQWLGVDSDNLANPQIGAVSEVTARQMCLGALTKTAEADLAVSITGHLGPNAPKHLDGVALCGIVLRSHLVVHVKKFQLTHTSEQWARSQRQISAAIQTFEFLDEFLSMDQNVEQSDESL